MVIIENGSCYFMRHCVTWRSRYSLIDGTPGDMHAIYGRCRLYSWRNISAIKYSLYFYLTAMKCWFYCELLLWVKYIMIHVALCVVHHQLTPSRDNKISWKQNACCVRNWRLRLHLITLHLFTYIDARCYGLVSLVMFFFDWNVILRSC